VTITAEQWAAAAADHGITVDELQTKIKEIDHTADERRARRQPPMHFDRDCEPITFGTWAMLYEALSYKRIATQILPNRYWIATIWQGVNVEEDDPPVVMESSVFVLKDSDQVLPGAVCRVEHTSLADALKVHTELVDRYARS
jgi:hypothetical protein